MRVGPLRAVVATHLLAKKNRLIKELGRSGVAVVVLVIALMVTTLLLPFLVMLGGAGWLVGRQLPNETATIVLGGLLSALAIVGGATSGVLGGAKQLAWESFRAYPVRSRTLLASELVASSLDLVPLVIGIGILVTLGGVAVAKPILIPLLFVIALESILVLLLVQLLVGSLAERMVRRLRTALAALGLALWMGLALTASIPEELRAGAGEVTRAKVDAITRVGAALQTFTSVLPATVTVFGLRYALEGKWYLALSTHLYVVAVVFVLAIVVARLLARDADRAIVGETPERARTWSFRTPAQGIAKLQIVTIIGSRIGQFGFVVPLIVVVLIRGPLAHATGRELWAVPAAFTYLSLVGNQFQLNQFGLDGHGVKAMLLLPIREADLFRGKTWGLAVYQGAQAAILVVLLAVLHRPLPLQMLSGLLLWACIFTVQNAVGRFTSVWMPRMLPRRSVRADATPIALVLVGLALSIVCGGFFGGVWAAFTLLRPALLPVVLSALFAACALVHRLSLPCATALLRTHRERLVVALG